MDKKRSNKERRSGKDRRKGVTSSYNGPERRSVKTRISGMERRKYKRLKIKDLAFVKAWCKHENEYVEDLGLLLDISRRGLSLRSYIKNEKASDHSGLGIFLSGDDFSIGKILFAIITTTEMISNSAYGKRLVWRYGMQFKDLNPYQIEKLDYFLANHTAGEP